MKYEDYKDIYFRLRNPKDIDRLSQSTGLDRELLLVMYTQSTVRDATRRFYIVKKDIKKIAKDWKRGDSIARLARMMNFPPVLLGLMLSAEIGLNRKQFWKYIRNPETCHDKRLRKELKQVAEEVIRCAPAGASMVHLHVRDTKGVQTEDIATYYISFFLSE